MQREPTHGESRSSGGDVSMAPEPRIRGRTALGFSVWHHDSVSGLYRACEWHASAI